jgi:pyridoxal phosphate enzyme (YggS family)
VTHDQEGPPPRERQVADGLAQVRERVARACAAAGRDGGDVTLVVVTKTYPVGDVRLLVRLGVRDVGENRDQEAASKAAACSDLDLRWHFIGRLQRNKARSVVRYAAMVHSVDRTVLVGALGRAAADAGRRLDCLVQVSLDGDPRRGGCPVSEVPALADGVAAEPALRLRGVMAVAPLGTPPRKAFGDLAKIWAIVRAGHPGADVMSAGMSDDLEEALALGATHLRVGSAVLGARPPLG